MKKAIAILCITPHAFHIEFYSQFTDEYDVYFICDKATDIVSDKITILHINDEESKNAKFYNANTSSTIKKTPTSWDKSLYYFCRLNTSYDFIWFLEEDVFVPNTNTLSNIDNKYKYDDHVLLPSNESYSNNPKWIHWYDKNNNIKMYRSMVCAIRVSRKMLEMIDTFVEMNEKLIFIEMLFNTIAYWTNLKVQVISELTTIKWKHAYSIETIKGDHLYHPVKSIDTQKQWNLDLNK